MSPERYFSEREAGEAPQTEAVVGTAAWKGIAALISTRIDDGSFGARYPKACPDGAGPFGTDATTFWEAMKADVPDLPEIPLAILSDDEAPSTLVAMDIIEFCWRAVGRPVPRAHSYHAYFGHHHLDFDTEVGQRELRDDVNRIFRRNRLGFELTETGQVQRLAPVGLREALRQAVFSAGDATLDELLEAARTKFLDPDEIVRREALEKLWDAWERIKTIEQGSNKSVQATLLLDRTAGQNSSKFREMLEREARELTSIGNTFQIRHSETTQERLVGSNEVDYLFHRLFSFIRLALRATGRGG